MRGYRCRPTSRCGVRFGCTVTPRRRSPGGLWLCLRAQWPRCASTGSGKPRPGWPLESCGRTPAWCSRAVWVRRSMPRTSGVTSGLCTRRRVSRTCGHRGSCGIRSSRSCPSPVWLWKRSPGWLDIPAPGPPKSSTGTSFGR